jgi:hypothetical protein
MHLLNTKKSPLAVLVVLVLMMVMHATCGASDWKVVLSALLHSLLLVLPRSKDVEQMTSSFSSSLCLQCVADFQFHWLLMLAELQQTNP